jgi:endonuclease YncB( thermonuclease family)
LQAGVPLLVTRSGFCVAVALVLALGCACTRDGGGCAPVRPAKGGDEHPAAARNQPAAAAGTVVRVRDGDSLVVFVGGTDLEVRLDSVDAPELQQAFGWRAKRCTADLVFGKQVRLDVKGQDKYDRKLAEVFLPDGRSLNRELVSAGCAWWFRRYSADADLAAREQQARADRRGLWADADPVPPWDFREEHPRGPSGGR